MQSVCSFQVLPVLLGRCRPVPPLVTLVSWWGTSAHARFSHFQCEEQTNTTVNSLEAFRMAATEASFGFLQWQPYYDEQKPYEVFLPLLSFGENNGKIPRSNLVFESRKVVVTDVHGRHADFGLDTHGFQFVRQPTTAQDLKDRRVVNEHYIPEMEAALRRHLGTGAGCKGDDVRTFCFDLRVGESLRLIASLGVDLGFQS